MAGAPAVIEPGPSLYSAPLRAMSGLLESVARRRRASAGRRLAPSTADNGAAPSAPAAVDTPSTVLARGRVRRRARYLRRLREIQLRDIGGFLLELHRAGREQPNLVRAKVLSAARTDGELRALERALGEPVAVRELREAGIGGACQNCGAVYGSADRYCASCGSPLSPQS